MSNRTEFQNERYSRPIRQLDRVLINKIAAGEVIERPASVVKELIENSFDAGASAIEIVARKSGTTYISVADDGCGISSAEVRLAFSRHATSKIKSLDDLFSVSSFGFRGEALPSIASVSHLTLTTRHFSEKDGTRIIIEGGKEIECRPASAPVGTKVEVSHLFFNTPARRKFLKAEITESRQIIRVAERMALSRPSVAINLELNDRKVFQLRQDQPLAERMGSLFGVESRSIVEYDVELNDISYLVYLAHPEQARQDRTRICLFINGRSVTSSTIIHAVTTGYGEFLPGGKFPLAAVFINVDPQRLDVNVHPTKAEVRLAEERAIHDNLYRIVKKALRDWRLIPVKGQVPIQESDRKDSPPAYDPSGHRRAFAPYRPPEISAHRTGPHRPPVNRDAFLAPDIYETPSCNNTRPSDDVSVRSEVSQETPVNGDITYLGQSGKLYLLFSIGGELYVVDQHAAHERVLYEQALLQVEQGSDAAQKLLFPESVELSAEEFLIYESSQAILTKLGFDIGPFGQKAVIINGMPPVFKDKNPGVILRRLLDDIMQLNKAGGELIKSAAQSLACRAAVMAGNRLTPEEAATLVKKLFATNNPYCCPHGRPTFIKISREELDGRFGRT